MINFGNTQISAIYYGTREISAVYKGSTLVWQKPSPSSELVYAILSGTGAYAKYNGLWTPSATEYTVGCFKADTAITGNLADNTFISFNFRNWPTEDGATSWSALAYKDWLTASNGQPIFYCKDFATYPSTYLDMKLPMSFAASGFTQGGRTVAPSTVYWYSGEDETTVTSGGHPGTLISSYLSAFPFDENYKRFFVVYKEGGSYSTHEPILGGPFTWVSGTTWLCDNNIASSSKRTYFEKGHWNSGTWDLSTPTEWAVVQRREEPPYDALFPVYLAAPTKPWPWLEGNITTWRFLNLIDDTPIYGTLAFIPAVESFKGYTITGAGTSSANGDYVLSGEYGGFKRFQKKDGNQVIAYRGNTWRIYASQSDLESDASYLYGCNYSLIGTTWGIEDGAYPAPSSKPYISFGDEGGGGGGGTGTVVFTCGGGSGSVTLNGVTKTTTGGGQQLTFDDLPEGEYPVTYGNMGSGPASVTVTAGETTSVTCNFPCFVAGTKITLADGTEKNVEDITYEDELLTWSFDEACYSKAKPVWILKEQDEAPAYMLSVYDDGSELKTVGPDGMHHELYDIDTHTFKYTDEMVGRRVFTTSGVKTCLACRIVKEPVRFYNIITAHDFNCFANGILTSCRLNKLYDIDEHMQFVKEERHFEHPALSGIDARLKEGLRLDELDNSYESYLAHLEKEKKN